MEATNFISTAQAAAAGGAGEGLGNSAAAGIIPSAKSFIEHLSTPSIITGTGIGIANNTSNITNTTTLSLSLYNIAAFISKIDENLIRPIPRFIGRSTGLDRVVRVVGDFWDVHGPAGTLALIRSAGTGGDSVGGIQTATGAGGIMADAAVGAGAAGAGAAAAADRSWSVLFSEAFQASSFKSYWGMLHYVTSRWAIMCLVTALVLNRVNVLGASRQRISLTWNKRLGLRIIPIMLFFTQIQSLLQAIRCQTSPDFALFRHGDLNKYSLLDWSRDGGWLHSVTSTILWWGDDQGACTAVGMARTEPGVRASLGSFALLWPTFIKLSVSHFVENLSCALQQMAPQTEVGMSVFEHSLAFAEAETMVSHATGLGHLGAAMGSNMLNQTVANVTLPSNGTIPASGTLLFISDTATAMFGSHSLNRLNVPVEVLIVALLSCCNAFSSHIISVLGQQKRLRLVNTGFWGICFMATFVWGFFTTSNMVRSDGSSEPRPVSGLLHFPTVAIIGFLPHITVVLGIIVCAVIYAVALLLTAISLGTNPQIRQPSSLSERISIAHDNLQAAIQLKGLALRWHEDFYTALLRTGFAALTAASEAVFLNEGRAVEMRQFTWLEEERLDELEVNRPDLPENGHFQIAEEYGLPPSYPGADDKGGVWQSGYTKERKFDKKEGQLQADGTYVYPNPRSDNVGALQRTTRFYLAFIHWRGVLYTLSGWAAFGVGNLLDWMRITARPNWLKKIVGKSLRRVEEENKKTRDNPGEKMLDFWLIDKNGKLAIPKNDDFDIEPEMKRRLLIDNPENINEILDEKMYEWWKMNGWFGAVDSSGDFQPSQGTEDQEDLTSVVSMSSAASTVDENEENAWESEEEGRRTPTQATANQSSWSFTSIARPRSMSPEDSPLDTETLARLLSQTDSASKEEARILASHLTAKSRIKTRSEYRKEINSERSRVLLAGRIPSQALILPSQQNLSKNRPLTTLEEAEVLEQLLLSRRKNKQPPITLAPGTEDDDANRTAGPPCVVCQSSARTIICWPCRCLALCEDCRVSLAMNNFGNCVTCRRNVGGFVRLYVP